MKTVKENPGLLPSAQYSTVCLCVVVNIGYLGHPGDKPLGMSEREFLDWINGGGKTQPERGRQSVGQSPGC